MSVSWQTRVIRLFGVLFVRPGFTRGLNVKKVRAGDLHEPPEKFQKSCTITSQEVDDSRYFEVTPAEITSDSVVVYIHGGAYVGSFKDYSWTMATRLATDLGCKVVLPAYRLTPEYTVIEAMQDVRVAFDALRKQNPQRIALMGDSAGAGLAMAAVLAMKERGEPLVDSLVLCSPWLDVRLKNPDIDATLQKREKILALPGLQEAGELYAGTLGIDHPYASPIEGNLEGLPPILLQIGSHDVFYPDSLLFADKVNAVGGDVQLTVGEGMPHDWMMMGPVLPEAEPAAREIMTFIAKHFDH